MAECDRLQLFKKSKSAATERQRLEILLANLLPENAAAAAAERLAECFPSLDALLTAPAAEVLAVEGVPRRAAQYLICIGRCRQVADNFCGNAPPLTREGFAQFAAQRLKGRDNECGEIFLVGRSGKILKSRPFTSANIQFVRLNAADLFTLISDIDCRGAYLAHNHINCPALPSAEDDEFTRKLKAVCAKCGIRLFDHAIVNNFGEHFSYALSGRLEKL